MGAVIGEIFSCHFLLILDFTVVSRENVAVFSPKFKMQTSLPKNGEYQQHR